MSSIIDKAYVLEYKSILPNIHHWKIDPGYLLEFKSYIPLLEAFNLSDKEDPKCL